MPHRKRSPKLTITIDHDVQVAAIVSLAAGEAQRQRTGLAAVAAWERQFGQFTAEEMHEARCGVREQIGRLYEASSLPLVSGRKNTMTAPKRK